MAATHPSRRPAKPTSTVPKSKSNSKSPHTNILTSPDDLAHHVSNLTISTKPKPKSKAPLSSGDGSSTTRVAAAMRAVNAASQSLSGLVQSGWRAGSGKKSSEAVGAGENALKELRELRLVCVGDVDVERAASSVVGKLVVLEMYDTALSVLMEMRTPISALYGPPTPKPATQTDVLAIPLPPSSTSLSETLQTLISTYLLHALVILSHKFQSQYQSQSQWQALSNTLQSTPTLLQWLPHLPSLQPKHKDSILTRAYSVLAKLPSSPSPSPSNHPASNSSSNSRTTFELRTYALHYLLHTSPGCIEPNTFWDQATKFCIVFVRSSSSHLPSTSNTRGQTGEEEVVRAVLSAFGVLVSGVDAREDQGGWMRGRGFVGFCECWMGFAKRAGDIEVLDRISKLMQGASPASSPSSSTSQPRPQSQPHAQPRTQTSPDELTPSVPRIQKEKDALILEGARICAVFARATAVVERYHGRDRDPDGENELTNGMNEATTFLTRCRALFALSWDIKCGGEEVEDEDGDGDGNLRRAKGKAERALERLRRAAVKLLDAMPKVRDRGGVKAFLSGVVSVYEGFEKQDADIITPALDTLFVLARTTLVTTEYETYNIAYEYLLRATKLLGLSPSSDHPSSPPDLANYVRCISGAYHNLAGTLYQDGKYVGAVRFLKEGCALGGRALVLRGRDGDEVEQTEGEGKGEEGWKLLREQLYRRWELLGICYSKMGERWPAYEAFIECVKSYPYADVAFAQSAGTNALSAVFTSPASAKQLGVIIDRLTYIGTCELLLQPPEVSLKPPLESCNLPSAIIGTIIERQIEGLEGSLWKEDVQKVVKTLLADALDVYSVSGGMPIRRARVLIRCLEFGYRVAEDAGVSRHPDDIGEEAEELLGRNVLGQDASLAQFCPQYRALLHFWLALHAHRREDPQQASLIAHHSEEACRILKSFFIGSATEPLNKASPTKKSPKTLKGKGKATTTGTKPAVARRGPPTKSSRNLDPVTPKSRKALEPVTLNTSQVTPPRPAGSVKNSVLVFDDFDKLLGLLRMVSHLLGLLGLVLVKVKLLDVTRRLCEQHSGTSHDGYITASVDLAHEYVKLGKLAKASTIYGQALIAIRNGGPSDEIRTTFLLRYAESLAIVNNVLRSSSTYCEALGLSTNLPGEDKGMSTAQRVKARVGSLERAAIAAHTYGVIQYARDDLTGSLDGMLQSLRLWNRAVDTLARLNPPPVSKSAPEPDENPFEMSSLKAALPGSESDQPELSAPKKTFKRRPAMDGLEWRITDGLLNTLFALCQAYFARGSPREADYFAQQAQDLAESLNAPAMVSRALTRKGEIQLHQGQLDGGYVSLMRAAELLEDLPGPDAADIRRLRGYYSQLKAMHGDAHELYEGAARMLEELEKLFSGLDGLPSGLRKSTGLSPKAAPTKEVIVPALLAAVLRQHIWLLRDDVGDECSRLLERFVDLPPTDETKSEENALMARLTLHDVYGRFRADMFLSSLVESTIALPMGMSGDKLFSLSPSTQEILTILDNAEKLFWADLAIVARRGKVSRVRDATVSLAMIRALQSSLGRATKMAPVLTAGLLDASAAVTLRRELLEAIQQKFPNLQAFDDLQWPLITPNGSPLPRPKTRMRARMALLDSEDEDDGSNLDETSLKQYWDSIRDKYNNRPFDLANLSASQADCLPKNWTVISINITEDKNTMFVTRQRAQQEPLIFCVPLRGRRETEEDEHLTFDDALNELKQIITLSNQGTRQAIHVKNDDPQARASWWAERSALDKRMQELLENIEFCWLGAFKTILSQPMKISPDIITDLRTRFDKVFKRSLQSQERKQKTKFRVDDNLLECFSTLSPKCRDEELEDLVYFILDLYQLHGVPVAISDVDIDQVVVDLRTALEEHAVKSRGKVTPVEDNHMFLVLDKNVQGIPWESIPILRGRSVSRIPSMDFLVDRLEFAKWQKSAGRQESDAVVDRAEVDPRKTYYVLNPSGDLRGTEGRFSSWLQEMNDVGWEGTIGRPPSEQQFLNALARKDLVVYFGHGGGEQYVRSHKIRHLPRCAATMLWGCSSGALREMGDFDRVGTPYIYMLAGCPTLVANIWDVTDRDIDKFSQAVFDKMRLNTTGLRQHAQQARSHTSTEGVSLVAAVAQSRGICKLKYLTGAAPVVYGIPFYL